tara:strand:- start:24 stop:599 length:576 start_codon:yes stop_codon:yes gene_type:complete
MNALQNITDEARVLVTNLWEQELAKLNSMNIGYNTWMSIGGNPIMNQYSSSGEVDNYSSISKYVYMTIYRSYDRELGAYVTPTTFDAGAARRAFNSNKELSYYTQTLRMMLRDKWEVGYGEDFIASNMYKLERALAKHLNNDMSATNINVSRGCDGAEVTADVDGMRFKTFGTLCGGYIQCLHYRYRSSLK